MKTVPGPEVVIRSLPGPHVCPLVPGAVHLGHPCLAKHPIHRPQCYILAWFSPTAQARFPLSGAFCLCVRGEVASVQEGCDWCIVHRRHVLQIADYIRCSHLGQSIPWYL